MSLDCDVAVVGAGPAGALVARQLAGAGVDVVLLDKADFPRFKVCGCCLNADALATLARAGLDPAVQALGGEPLTRLLARAGGRQVAMPLPGGLAVSRAALDEALVAGAVEQGAHWRPRTTACDIEPAGPGHRLGLRERGGGRRSLTARLVVAADGLGGRFLRSATGFTESVDDRARMGIGTVVADGGAELEANAIHMACAADGYCGLVRLEQGGVAAAAAVDRTFLHRVGGPAAAATRLLAEAGQPAPAILRSARWQGTPELARHTRPLARPGIYAIGDAAGYVEPFTGEGMAWALAGGEAIAELAGAALACGELPDPDAWAERHRRLCGPRHRRCRHVARALRHPTLVRTAVAALGRYPGVGAALARPFGAARAHPATTPLH